jgi:hypothetical protein
MVPFQWMAMITALRQAQVARDGMRNPEVTSQMRDAATVDYSRALDLIFEALDAMMEAGVLSRIASLLHKPERQ